MKKFFIFFVFILFLVCICIDLRTKSYVKVLKVISPFEVILDENKNFILDEKTSFLINDLHDVSDYNGSISIEKRIIFKYFANSFAQDILKNNFVIVKNNDLIINGKRYKNLLLDSGFFYDNSEISYKKFQSFLENFDAKTYVAFNKRTKKYHNLFCENALKSSNSIIIKIQDLPKEAFSAKCCIKSLNQSKIKEFEQKKSEPFSYQAGGTLDIFFLDLNEVMIPNNTCNTKACLTLKSEIDNAKKTIDFAVYGFNNQPEILNALLRAKKRGVVIRWISHNSDDNKSYYPDIEKLRVLFPSLNNGLSEIKRNSYGIMHNKFFIFDNKKVFTGSSNITSTDLSGFNANYSILISSEDVASIYQKEFDQMYNGNLGMYKTDLNKNSKKIILDSDLSLTVLFSPQDMVIDNYILDLILNAKTYIYIPVFFITDKKVQDALISAKTRGVDVRIIQDATSAKSLYTIHHQLRQNNIKVKTENYAGKMHIKSIVIDDKYSVIGSMNYTVSGNLRNDENIIIIDNYKIAKYLKEKFLYLWNKIPDKYLYYDPKAESLESIGSCFDGIDNDFDKKIDMNDDACIIKQ